MTTDVELVAELEKRNLGGRYDELINNAICGMYHDFKSEEPFPKTLLILHLDNFAELEDIIEDVENGMYDEDPITN